MLLLYVKKNFFNRSEEYLVRKFLGDLGGLFDLLEVFFEYIKSV